jgi:hypothetical protein
MTAAPTSRHEKLLAGGVSFAKTTAKSKFFTFKILAQVLVDYHF